MSREKQAPPQGFVLQNIVGIAGDSMFGRLEQSLSLLLPIDKAVDLAKHHQAVLTERIQQTHLSEATAFSGLSNTEHTEEDRAIARKKRISKIKEQEPSDLPYQERAERDKAAKLTAEREAQRKALKRLHAKQSRRSKSSVEVYDWEEPLKLVVGSTKIVDRDYVNRAKAIYEELATRGSFRELSQTDLSVFDRFEEMHPIYTEVIAYVRQQVRLCQLADKPIQIPPMLLLGEAGVGKTHFANSLSKVLNTDIHRINFDSNVTSSSLLGSASHWGNTTPGLVTNAVLFGKDANPVVLMEEIDKASSGQAVGYQDPRASLHSLLEPVSSSAVKDISLDFQFNASFVTFIATANLPSLIPETLRSRFTEFHISRPTGDMALRMASVMTTATHSKMNLPGFQEPSYEIAKLIAHLTPREQRQALERAYSSAVAAGRSELLRTDFSADVLLDDLDTQPKSRQSWIH